MSGAQRVMLYTAEGLFELPPSYMAHGLAIKPFRSYQSIGFGKGDSDDFSDRSVAHGAFRADHVPPLGDMSVLSTLALIGQVVVITNDVVGTDEPPPPSRQVLWCVEIQICPPHRGLYERLGTGILMPVPRTRALDAALAVSEERVRDNAHLDHPNVLDQMTGSLRQTTSFFCPTEWPLAKSVERLDYVEALFAMTLRPAPMQARRDEEGRWLHAEDPVPEYWLNHDEVPFSTVASVTTRSVGRPRALQVHHLQRALPTLPDDILDRIFTMAARHGLAGNTKSDWESHLALRAVNRATRDVVRAVSLGIITELQVGIAALTPARATASWPEVRALREVALRANLHVIDVVLHGTRLDEWTIARIRLGMEAACHPRDLSFEPAFDRFPWTLCD